MLLLSTSSPAEKQKLKFPFAYKQRAFIIIQMAYVITADVIQGWRAMLSLTVSLNSQCPDLLYPILYQRIPLSLEATVLV